MIPLRSTSPRALGLCPRSASYRAAALVVFALLACKGPAQPAVDAGPLVALRALPPVVRHAEVGWPMPSGYLVAAAHLSAGEVASRAWFHIAHDGAVARVPARWRIHTQAHLEASADGRSLVWVEPNGELFRVDAASATGPSSAALPSPPKPSHQRGEAVRIAQGADGQVRPRFVQGGAVVYARLDGAVLILDGRGSRVLWRGAFGRLTDLATDPGRQRAVAVVGGEALAVVDLGTARGHIAYRASAKDAKLFGPRFGPDGALYVRERRQARSRLMHIPTHGGDVRALALPPGRLRAFDVRPDGTFWLGFARRGKGMVLGEVVEARPSPGKDVHEHAESRVQSAAGSGTAGTAAPAQPALQSRRLAVFARTLPQPYATCDGAMFLVEEDGRTARLVRVDIASGATRILSPPTLRLLSPERAVALCSP